MLDVFQLLKFLADFDLKDIFHLFLHSPHLLFVLFLLNLKLSQWITKEKYSNKINKILNEGGKRERGEEGKKRKIVKR